MNIRLWALVLILGIGTGSPAYAASSETLAKVQEIYVAYYGRPADPGGLQWWADELEKNGGDLTAIIDAFGTSEEYTARFGSLNTTELLTNLYQQMFGREAENDGLAWWRTQISSGEYTLGQAAVAIAGGASDGDALDRTTLTKRTQVAQAFTDQISAQSKAYTLGNVPEARELIMGVNATTDVSSFTSGSSFTSALATMPAGGDGGIKVVHAEVTSQNSSSLGVGAARGIKKSIANQQTQNRTSGLAGGLGSFATGVIVDGACESGTLDFEFNAQDFSTLNMTYNQCVIESDIFNGGLNFSSSNNGLNSTIQFVNLSIFDGTENYTMTMDGTMQYELSADMTTATTIFQQFSYADSWGDAYYWEYAVITCTDITNPNGGNCDFDEAQFVDAWTGETYYIEGDQVTQTSGGYQVSTKVYDTEYGYVDVYTTSDLVLDANCSTGMFTSGTIVVEGADGSSAQLQFVDCNTFTLTVNGAAQTYTWEQFKQL